MMVCLGVLLIFLVPYCLFTHFDPSLVSLPVNLTIDIDIHHPEQNILFLVVPFTGIEDEQGYLYNGYEILAPGDLSDFAVNVYKANILNAQA